MKKILAFVLTAFLVLSVCGFSVSAKELVSASMDDVTVKAGKTATFTVSLSVDSSSKGIASGAVSFGDFSKGLTLKSAEWLDFSNLMIKNISIEKRQGVFALGDLGDSDKEVTFKGDSKLLMFTVSVASSVKAGEYKIPVTLKFQGLENGTTEIAVSGGKLIVEEDGGTSEEPASSDEPEEKEDAEKEDKPTENEDEPASDKKDEDSKKDDKKDDTAEEKSETSNALPIILIVIAAVVAAALIAVIAVVLSKKKNGKN